MDIMLGPTRLMLEEYKFIVKKMAIDAHNEHAAKKNLKMLLESEVMLAFLGLMPMFVSGQYFDYICTKPCILHS